MIQGGRPLPMDDPLLMKRLGAVKDSGVARGYGGSLRAPRMDSPLNILAPKTQRARIDAHFLCFLPPFQEQLAFPLLRVLCHCSLDFMSILITTRTK